MLKSSSSIVPAFFAAGFNTLFAFSSLTEMHLICPQNQILGCYSKTFACESLESRAAESAYRLTPDSLSQDTQGCRELMDFL